MKSSLLKLFYQLLFFPQIFVKIRNDKRWKLGVLRLFSLFTLFYCIIFSITLPQKAKYNAKVTSWFAKQVQEIKYVEGKFEFVTQKQMPFEAFYEDYQLLMSNDKLPSSSDMKADSGLALSSESVVAWVTQDGKRMVQPLYITGDDTSLIDMAFRSKDTITSKDYPTIGSYMVIFLALADYISSFISMLLVTFGFAVLHSFLRSPIFMGLRKRDIFNIYNYAAIIPASVALIYSSLGIQVLDFFSVFLFALLFYIFIYVGKYLIPVDILKQMKENQ